MLATGGTSQRYQMMLSSSSVLARGLLASNRRRSISSCHQSNLISTSCRRGMSKLSGGNMCIFHLTLNTRPSYGYRMYSDGNKTLDKKNSSNDKSASQVSQHSEAADIGENPIKEAKDEDEKPAGGKVAAAAAQPPAVKEPLSVRIKEALMHYWDGTKLLGYEIKISTKLVMKMVAGYELSRRENRQLQRTVTDLARLVPFSMFVIVPFAELLLPVALKLFPNMLPSTYEGAADKEKRNKKLRTTRKEMSQILRQTVEESGMSMPRPASSEQRKQFADFFRKVRSSGEKPTKEELFNVCRMFKDDVILDNLSRPQLVALARYLNLNTFGTDLMLRYQIRHKMRQIKRDDRAIDYEGVDTLSVPELQSASAARGIKSYEASPAELREQLSAWLKLRLHEKVPSTLLLLSAAYAYGQIEFTEDSYVRALESVLSSIPDELYHEAELEVHQAEGTVTNKQRLEVIREQEELIKDENEQEEKSGHKIKVRDDINVDEDNTTKSNNNDNNNTAIDTAKQVDQLPKGGDTADNTTTKVLPPSDVAEKPEQAKQTQH